MQATTLMSYITNDSDWGEWPKFHLWIYCLGVMLKLG